MVVLMVVLLCPVTSQDHRCLNNKSTLFQYLCDSDKSKTYEDNDKVKGMKLTVREDEFADGLNVNQRIGPTLPSNDSGDEGLGVGAIIGIIIAVVVCLIVVAFLYKFCCRKRRNADSDKSNYGSTGGHQERCEPRRSFPTARPGTDSCSGGNTGTGGYGRYGDHDGNAGNGRDTSYGSNTGFGGTGHTAVSINRPYVPDQPAHIDTSDVEPNPSVGPPLEIIQYSHDQWKGETANPVKYRKGYREVRDIYGLGHLRVIRGDNYCAVRSTIYQALVNARQAIRDCIGDRDLVIKEKLQIFKDGTYGLHNWSFGNNLDAANNVYVKVVRCINRFYNMMDTLDNSADPGRTLEDYFNAAPDNDPEIMEAVKVLMMLKFIDLHQQLERGEELPEILSTILFRNTSETPAAFFRNHLDKVGNEGGLEQIEMRLLSHTLGIEIRAYRMIQFGQSDFMTNYSETPGLPPVNIISEDDRHYNIVVP